MDHLTRTSMADNSLGSPDMPDLVIYDILMRLPTKFVWQVSYASKQWGDAIFSAHVLNFDEDDDFDRHRHNLNSNSDYVHQHHKFINFLKGYQEHRDNRKHIYKLRLHTGVVMYEEAVIVDRLLEVAIEGDVKELDINLIISVDQDPLSKLSWVRLYNYWIWICYCLPWAIFVNASSLTSLNLEYVRVLDIRDGPYRPRLPSLKTMSLTAARLHDDSFFPLLWISSSIEYLSLTACSFEGDGPWCEVFCESLKCLEFKYCHLLRSLTVECKNLESFTLVAYTGCSLVMVDIGDSPKLKKIDISVDELQILHVWPCHRALEAIINVQSLRLLKFFGSLEAQVSVKACWKSIIWVHELWDKEWFLSNPKNLFTLIEFLQGFGCCKKVWLCTRDSKSLIIPESFRKTIGTFPTPLPESCTLNVAMPNPPKPGSRDYLDLNDSINWIAHSARIVKQNPRWLVEFFETLQRKQLAN